MPYICNASNFIRTKCNVPHDCYLDDVCRAIFEAMYRMHVASRSVLFDGLLLTNDSYQAFAAKMRADVYIVNNYGCLLFVSFIYGTTDSVTYGRDTFVQSLCRSMIVLDYAASTNKPSSRVVILLPQ